MFTGNSDPSPSNHDAQQTIEDEILLNYYKSLAMYHPDLIAVFSLDGELLSQNRNSINEFMGFSSKEQLNFQELVPKTSYAVLNSAFKKALKGKTERHETTVINKQGQLVYVFLTFIPIKREKHHVEGVYLIIEDITAYKNLTHTLELSEKHLLHAQQIAEVGYGFHSRGWSFVSKRRFIMKETG